MTFKAAYPDWTSCCRPVKAESVEDAETFNKGWTTLKNDWLSGPFKLEKYDNTQKVLTQVPNDKWWGDKPLLDKMTFRAISPDATARLRERRARHLRHRARPRRLPRAKGVADATIREAAGPNFRHFTFNTKAGLLKDQNVRQAIVKGLDRERSASPTWPGSTGPPAAEQQHLVQQPGGLQGHRRGDRHRLRPREGEVRPRRAGWTAGADGVREKDGKKLEVKFSQLAGVKVSENEALQAQNQLKAIGVKVDIVAVPIAKFQDGSVLSNHEFEIIAFSWIGTPYPFGGIKQIYGTGSETNYSQVSIPRVDEMAKKIDSTTDAAGSTLANEAAKLIWENVMTLPLYQRPELIAAKSKLANYGAFGLSTCAGRTSATRSSQPLRHLS